MEKPTLSRKKTVLGGAMIPSPAGNPIGIVVDHSPVVSIYMTNGIKLQGIIDWADDEVIVLRENRHQIVFKHAVATICLENGTFLFE